MGNWDSLRALRTSAVLRTTAKRMARAPAAHPDCSMARRAASPTSPEVVRDHAVGVASRAVAVKMEFRMRNFPPPRSGRCASKQSCVAKARIVFVTSEGKHRVAFSDKAKQQLFKILSE